MNTLFNYRYCDASGYSSWGEVVFEGAFDDSLLLRLTGALESREFFIADQVRVPELFFETSSLDDHCFHVFHRLEVTYAALSDPFGRRIDAFVSEVERASADGWRIFDPQERKRAPLSARISARRREASLVAGGPAGSVAGAPAAPRAR